MRDQKLRDAHAAKKELDMLLIEKKKKFADFIRKYLKPYKKKESEPSLKNQTPKKKMKFSSSIPLIKV